MTNKEAVNWIINLSADIGKSEHSELWHYEQALYEIREILESEQPGWIPVTERLPENDVDVIATGVYMGHNPYVEIASCNDGRWSSYMDEYKVHPTLHKIIAWMPLPEPYKEENE